MSTTCILVVGDDLGLAADLLLSLERQGRANVLGPVRDATSALEPIDSGLLDVVVVDLDRSDDDALLILAQLREYAPGLRLLAVSREWRADVAALALASGAGGLLSRQSVARQLSTAMDRLIAGELVLPDQLRGVRAASLTRRELEVTRLLARGLSTGEIAKELGIAVTTVQSHVGRVLRKLEVHSQVEAVRILWRRGLLPLPASA